MRVLSDAPLARIISLGGGVQSVALCLMVKHGQIEPVDAAIFADTGAESEHTYRRLWQLVAEDVLPFPVIIASAGNLRDDILRAVQDGSRCSTPPLYVTNPKGGRGGMLMRKCTRDYKVRVVKRAARRFLGVPARGKVPGHVEQFMGITTDEADRMTRSRVAWVQLRYPLIDLGMSRQDCERWLIDAGYEVPRKSACVFCPYGSNARFAAMREEGGLDWKQAVQVDRAVRPGVDGSSREAFVHRRFKPLEEAVLDEDLPDAFSNECGGYCGV